MSSMTKYERLSYERKRLQSEGLAPSWLSTAGYQLLTGKHYLDTAETPVDMYDRIAARAEELTKVKLPGDFGYTTWYDAFYDVMFKGWTSPSTPALTNMGNDRGHPIACLTGDSWINTAHEGGTLMRDLKVGDEVLTHTGLFRKVTCKQSRMSDDDLYQLKVSTRTTPIKITGNHPVKTNKGWVRVDELDPSKHLIATNDIITYTPISHTIDMKKYITYPTVLKDGLIYRAQNTKSTKPSRQLPDGISKQSSPIKESIIVTPDLSWALGLWFAEGSHCMDKNGKLNGIKITMSVHELDYINKFAGIMKHSFGVTSTISKHGRKGNDPTWAVCTINNSTLSEMFFKEFGRGAKSKNLAAWMKTLPKEHLRAIIDGVYIGDGKKVTRNSTYITLTNAKLVMSLYEVGLKAGMQIGLQMQEKAGKGASVKYVQRLNLYNYKLGTSPHSIHSIPFEDGLRYCPFKLQKLSSNEVVYDITVEKDHSFSTAGVVVHNCSGSYLGDSIRDWYIARLEIAQLTQRGYGTSTVLDPVRPRGSAISKGGTANGIMQPAKGLVEDMKEISQGSSRRGNIGQYLDPLHPDFDELVDQLLADDDTWNIGWNITDEFEELFNKDPERADHIWKRMLRLKLIKGKGYFFFIDKVNRSSPKMYKDRGFKVRGSNLCVTGDTKILTDTGYVPIESVVGTTQNIWDGKEWVEAPIFKTSDGQKVLTVKLDNTVEIKATPYHRWYIQEGYSSKPVIKCTEELRPGDKLAKFELEPIPHGTKTLDLAYVNGFHTGDGTVYKDNGRARISLHDNKQLLQSRFSGYRKTSYTKDGRILNLMYGAGVLKDKFFIPDATYTVASRIKWLEGYLDADGTLTSNNGTESIQVACINLEFLQELLLLLQELGIHSNISKVTDAGYTKLPMNDGSGEYKDYWTKTIYRLIIAGSSLTHLLALGYNASRVQPTKRRYQRESRHFIQVQEVIDNEEVQPTYCGTNSKNETLMLNGVQTLNCSEIQLMADKDHSFTCVLTSMNVTKFDEWKDTKAVEITMVLLDALIEDMLIKAKKEPGFERVIAFTEKSRAVGLGILGEATYYQQKGWVFGDVQSSIFNKQLVKLLDDRSLAASKWLAKEIGEPEWLKGYGERFSHRLAFPPTKSTAEIQGGPSEGWTYTPLSI